MKIFIKAILIFLFVTRMGNAFAQNDLPSPSANIETIPAGAWVVPMDNTYQGSAGVMNLKAYGLINQLLWNDIHVKWAIKAGKGQDSTDFSVNSTMNFPSIDTSNALPGQNFETVTMNPNWVSSGSGGTMSTASKFNGGKSWRMAKNQSVTMTNTSLVNYSNVQLSVAFASTGNLPLTADLFLDISYDNGVTWTGTGSVKLAAGDGSTSFNINATNGNTVASNPYTVNIPSTATQINVRLRTTNTGTWTGSMFYFVDDIKLTGTFSRPFVSGPFIIMPADTAAARTVINSYNSPLAAASKVNVYKINSSVNADIRYTLTHKPMIAVYNDGGNANIHTAYLVNAGISTTYYDTLGSGHMIDSLTCYTFACTPHWTPGTYVHSDSIRLNNLAAFLRNGGNFLAECEGINAVESYAPTRYMTTTGINEFNDKVSTVQYMNMDMPVMQINGALAPGGGSLQNWNLPGGGAFKYPRYKGVYFVTTDTANIVNVTKYGSPNAIGGNLIYLGGHSYGNTTVADLNGERIFLNSIFIPSHNLATIASATSNNIVCLGDTIKLFGHPPYAGYAMNWTGPNSFTSSLQSPTIANATALNAGTYTFTITTNDHSCSYPFTTTITIPARPSITASASSTTICEDDSVTLSFSSTTGFSTASWYIDTAAACKPTGSPIGTGLTLKVAPTSTTKYIVVGYLTSGNCPDTATNCVTVTVDKKPVITSAKSTSTPICYGTGVSATITAGSGGSGCSETYQWRQDAGTWNTYTSGTTVGTTANDSIEIKATRNCTISGCSGKVVRSRWTVAAQIDKTSNSTLTDCAVSAGSVAQLSGTNPSPGTGLWTKTSGAGTVVNPTGYLASITGLSLNGTPTVVKWVVTNIYGCKDSSSVTITPRVRDSTQLSKYDSANYCLTCPVLNGGLYYFYDLNGNLLGTVKDINDANSLSNTSFCANLNYNPSSTPTSSDVATVPASNGDQQPYLPRDWTIHSDTTAPYTATLYFSDAEVNALMARASSSMFPFTDVSQLAIVMYPSASGAEMPPGSPNPVLIYPTFLKVGNVWQATFTTIGSGTFYMYPQEYPYTFLPVELINLRAAPSENFITVSWSTASEKNNNYFDVERSEDGIRFEKIGTVKGNGTSNTIRNYSFIDKNVAVNTQYYYRLKQVDNNNGFTYTKSVSSMIRSDEKFTVGNLIPNPASKSTFIEISSDISSDITVKIFTLDGMNVFQNTYALQTGLNKIELDVSQIPTGSYVCRFESTDSVFVKRLIMIQ